jgi:mRNA interferase MazF
MRRGDIYWAHVPSPVGRRPVLVVTRTNALTFLTRITVAPITTVVRGIPTEVGVGADNGLPRASVAGCDSLMTIDRGDIDPERIGSLRASQLVDLDNALKFALGIVS